MKIHPISYSTPDWMAFDKFTTLATGKSPIRYFDEHTITPGSLYSYIIAIELFLSKGNWNHNRISKADVSLNHISLSFAIECDEMDYDVFMDLRCFRNTIVNRNMRSGDNTFILMSLTLKEWKDEIIRHNSVSTETWIRKVFNDFYMLFKQFGLSELFDDYHSYSSTDGTFYLELEG
jgi:hypothetical protein